MPATAVVLSVLLAAPPAPARGPWLVPPVRSEVARAFAYAGDPFARGHHRGIDLAARPGGPVRAACGGRVTFAGRAGANGRAVAIRCGAWSVTHLPLRELAVRPGERVAAGTQIGAAAASREHAGLHLGVRRAADRRGYVDPAPLLRNPPRHAPPVAPRAAARRPIPPPPRPAPLPSAPAPRSPPRTAPVPAPRPPPLPRTAPAPPAPAPQPGSSPIPAALAPWPAWAGLALLLSGALGAGRARAARRRRAPLAGAAAREVR